jgi:hypothetical protein
MLPATLAAVLKEIRTYSPAEWELFVEEWVRSLRKKYVEVKRLGGTGDLGRDVVAFTDQQGLEGVWDNYQCKHLEKPMPVPAAGVEIAKLIYFVFQQKFRAPRRMFFVAPRDVATGLADLLASPSHLKSYVLQHWNSNYAKRITDHQSIPVDGNLQIFVEGFDFSIFKYYQTSEVISDHRTTAHWTERFGGVLPAPPASVVPAAVQDFESAYLEQLLKVYSELRSCVFGSCGALSADADLFEDLAQQRERFFSAEAFTHHYRDETEPGTVEAFVDDIFFSIDPVAKQNHGTGYDRLNACLQQAASVNAGGILSLHARPKTKQGVCHQLANSQRISWMSND